MNGVSGISEFFQSLEKLLIGQEPALHKKSLFGESSVRKVDFIDRVVIFVCTVLNTYLRLKDCPERKQLAENQSFEGSCEILRSIFKQRTLSSDIPAA